MSKVIIAGGRKFNNIELMRQVLNRLMDEGFLSPEDELVCGMALGADLLAKRIYDDAGLTVHERPADWQDMTEPCVRRVGNHGPYNALAGHKRNMTMAVESQKLIAFWNRKSTGTKDMIKRMKRLKKPVKIIYY